MNQNQSSIVLPESKIVFFRFIRWKLEEKKFVKKKLKKFLYKTKQKNYSFYGDKNIFNSIYAKKRDDKILSKTTY